MKGKITKLLTSLFIVLATVILAFSLSPMAVEPAAGKVYPTPLAAADALLRAGSLGDTAALMEVLGPEGKEVIFSGDETLDRKNRETFMLEVKEKITLYSMSENTIFLMVGNDDWPFPIPIVKGAKGWTWDVASGKEEVLSRRIGWDELTAIDLCTTFVEAERAYALANPEGLGVGVYAQRFLSSEGKRDGLYWLAKQGEPESPMGPLVAEAELAGYSAASPSSGPRPFCGYFFKILHAQGKDAPGGPKDFLKDGKMTGGFAMVAWPTEYGNSGIKTFLVNQTGIVFEKDLGPKTAELAKAMESFNPDLAWEPSDLEK